MTRVLLHVRALVAVAHAHRLLRHHTTTATLRAMTRNRRAVATLEPQRAAGAVRRAGRIIGANCLAQSVALGALLERAGASPSLVLGCRKYDDGQWGAHAWIQVDDTKLELVPAAVHQPLADLSAAHEWAVWPRAGGG